ncbi:hypothetical protein BD410DRAFT_380894 [Rickenella mellea]|uniref:Uncharacterized protein n=1 Tax=Rickenella mellea TaxID=50990 RepID=A0A4Y7PY91_9AGAM|nr:hypothetical protein BD410DRAFT_380894 [Rickenella mellea]
MLQEAWLFFTSGPNRSHWEHRPSMLHEVASGQRTFYTGDVNEKLPLPHFISPGMHESLLRIAFSTPNTKRLIFPRACSVMLVMTLIVFHYCNPRDYRRTS